MPRQVRWLLPFALVLTILLIVAGIWMATRPGTVEEGQVPGSSAGFFTPKSTTPVAFSLPYLADSGSSTRGLSSASLLGKPEVINLWASTCTICRTETPLYERLSRQLAGKVEMIGIDTADQKPDGQAFVRKYGVTYPQLFDPSAHVGTGYGVPGLPVTIFITAEGRVVGENLGAMTESSFMHYTRTLLGVS